MPHLTLSLSENIPNTSAFEPLFQDLHTILNKVTDIPISHCKSRVLFFSEFLVADGEENGSFAHLEVKLLAGRSSELKGAIGNQMLDILKKFYNLIDGMQISVELVDMDRECYFKHPPFK